MQSTSSQFTECFRCGYDLRETPDDQPCPECGLLAARSRRVNDEIRFSHPRWLRTISRGSKLILLGILLAGIWTLTAEQVVEEITTELYNGGPAQKISLLFNSNSLAANRNRDRYVAAVRDGAFFVGSIVVTIIPLIGIWLVTARDKNSPIIPGEHLRRIIIRIAAAAPGLGFAIGWEFEPHDKWGIALLAAVSVAVSITALLLFRYLRSVAARARSAHLAEHCNIVAIGSAAAVLILPLAALLDAYGSRWFKVLMPWDSPIYMATLFLMGLLLSLFSLWSLYLFTRFTISFHLALRRIKTLWQRDDQSER